jgi:hypothetical protein
VLVSVYDFVPNGTQWTTRDHKGLSDNPEGLSDNPEVPSQAINRDHPLELIYMNATNPDSDVHHLLEVLADRLNRPSATYLVIDGFDRLQRSTQVVLQIQLHYLETQGLRILLFRAVPELEASPTHRVGCDHCQSAGDDNNGLLIHWACGFCEYVLCDTCKSSGYHCRDRDHTMAEPYDFITIRLKSVPLELERFVRVDLETEYGSRLSDNIENIVEAICEPSDGNINLAKLRLDQIRDLETPSDILTIMDRLPREVVAFFDTEVQRINLEEPLLRYQTLLAIAAVAKVQKISLVDLEELLSSVDESAAEVGNCSFPYVRRVLESARGLLSTITRDLNRGDKESEKHVVVLYIRDLVWYIREDYNCDLILAKQHLRQVRAGERDLNGGSSFERTDLSKLKDVATPYTSLQKQYSADELPRRIPGQSIVSAILKQPGAICQPCFQAMFQTKANTGIQCWPTVDQQTSCPICRYAYGAMEVAQVHKTRFYWSRRTMGRTFNSSDHLVLTLRPIDLPDPVSVRRLVFMLKTEVGSVSGSKNLNKSTILENTGHQISKWLHKCKAEHVHCNHGRSNPYVPKRLVDLETEAPGRFRVIDRNEKDPERPYLTLSHSWGRKPEFLTLTTKNKDWLMSEGFSSAELRNKNFEEAIQVAQHLRIRYIWIDSLCICQAGKDKDFKQEGQYMHQVYQNSFCNIVAADSKGGDDGLFRQRFFSSLSGTDMGGSWVVLDKDLWAKELLQSPIYARGWVFQGKMITRRKKRTTELVQNECFLRASSISHDPKYSGIAVR